MNRLLFLFVAFLFALGSCIPDEIGDIDESYALSPGLQGPVVYGEVKIKDLITDTTYVKFYDDSLFAGHQRIKIYHALDCVQTAYDLLTVPRIADWDTTFTVGTLKLEDKTISDFEGIDFKELLDNYFTPATSASFKMLENQAWTNPEPLPMEKNQQNPSINVFREWFKYATFEKGTLSMSVQNGYNVPIRFNLHLIDALGRKLATFDYSTPIPAVYSGWLPAQSTVAEVRTTNLAGKKFTSGMRYKIDNLELGSFSNTKISLDSSLKLSVSIRGAEVSSGAVRLPEQYLTKNIEDWLNIDESDEFKHHKIHNLHVGYGSFQMSVTSGIDAKVIFGGSMPSVKMQSGKPFSDSVIFSGINSSVVKQIDLKGAKLRLKDHPTIKYNRLKSKMFFKIASEKETDGSLKYVRFDKDQGVNFKFTNTDSLHFSYADGNFSDEDIDITPGSESLSYKDLLGDMVSFDEIYFEEPKLDITVIHSLGITKADALLQLVGSNAQGKSVSLFPGEGKSLNLVEKNLAVKPANYYKTRLTLDKTSALPKLIGILPDKLEYSGNVKWTPVPMPHDSVTIHYLYDTSRLEIHTRTEFPLNMRIKNLTLKQEYAFDPGTDVKEVKSASIFWKQVNKFPIKVEVTAELLDTTLPEPLRVKGTLPITVLQPAVVDAKGNVVSPAIREDEIVLDEKMRNAYLSANRLRILVKLNTRDAEAAKTVIIHTDQSYQFEISAKAQTVITSENK